MKLMNRSVRIRLIAAVVLCLMLTVSCADRGTEYPEPAPSEAEPQNNAEPEKEEQPLPENPDHGASEKNALPFSVPIGENDFSVRIVDFESLLPGREIGNFMQYKENYLAVFSYLTDENRNRSSLRIDIFDVSSGVPVAVACPPVDGVKYTPKSLASLKYESAPEGLYFSFREYSGLNEISYPSGNSRYLLSGDPESGLVIRETEMQTEETKREARSEDGRYYADIQDGWLTVEDTKTGQKTQVYKNIEYEDNIGDVRGIGSLFFTEDNLLFYNIGGWEWTVGYGVYDPASGRNEVFENGAHIIRYDRRNGRLWYWESSLSIESIGVIDIKDYGILIPLADRSGYLASPAFLPDFQDSWDMDYFLLSRDCSFFIAFLSSTQSLSFYDSVHYTPLFRVEVKDRKPGDWYFNYSLIELEDIWVASIDDSRYLMVVKKR